MIERKSEVLNVARQLYKHDNRIYFKIFVSKKPFPKRIDMYSSEMIYYLAVSTEAPYSMYIYHTYARSFPNWKSAFAILCERVDTLSRKFGFDIVWAWEQLRKWENAGVSE